MKKVFSIFIVLVLFTYSSTEVKAQYGYHVGTLHHRVSAGPVISFFYNHPQMTTGTKRKLGANVAYKAEIVIARRTNLLVGLEYLSQGLIFKGYYKAPGGTYLFDGSYAYTHDLRYNELQLPIGLKLAMNSEREYGATPYALGGVGARYIFNSYVVITNDSTGTSPYDGKGDIGFEHEFVTKGFNAFFFGGFGLQKNYRDTGRALFVELTMRYGISRIRYEGYQNSNDIKIKEPNLAITFGFRL